MPKKGKKGFVMIEAMVVLAFLATTLLSIYTSFNNVLDRTKKRLYYDDPVFLYRTYYLLTYLERSGLTEFINVKFANESEVESETGTGTEIQKVLLLEYGCRSNVDDEEDPNDTSGSVNSISAKSPNFCRKIMREFEVSHVYIMPYNVNSIVYCTTQTEDLTCTRNSALRTFSNSAVDYLYTLDGYTATNLNASIANFDSGYRLVVEFKREDPTSYSYYDYINDSYETEEVTKTNYYYTTLEVPFGYNYGLNDYQSEYHVGDS